MLKSNIVKYLIGTSYWCRILSNSSLKISLQNRTDGGLTDSAQALSYLLYQDNVEECVITKFVPRHRYVIVQIFIRGQWRHIMPVVGSIAGDYVETQKINPRRDESLFLCQFRFVTSDVVLTSVTKPFFTIYSWPSTSVFQLAMSNWSYSQGIKFQLVQLAGCTNGN